MPHHFLIKGITLGDTPLPDALPIIQENRVNVVEIWRDNIDSSVQELIRKHRLGVIVRAPLTSLDDFNKTLDMGQNLRATMIHLELETHTDKALLDDCLEAASSTSIKLVCGLPAQSDSHNDNQITSLVNHAPTLRIVLDAKAFHYISEQDSLLDRVEMISCDATTLGNPFMTEGMRRWRRRNSPGTSFTVIVEATQHGGFEFETTWNTIEDAWQASIRG